MAGAGLDPGAAGRGLVLGAHGGVLHTAAVGNERQAVLGEVRNPPDALPQQLDAPGQLPVRLNTELRVDSLGVGPERRGTPAGNIISALKIRK